MTDIFFFFAPVRVLSILYQNPLGSHVFFHKQPGY